ncbi:hypothetical protein DBT73_RS21755 [Vibrio parahaemolyticus]|uniref:hypothetical protein n=1 Tax=Vibrio diabolicus TaxID=50719 RepID=UPI0021603917|nr:hypothetical protein [Vibrio diabolicus]EGR3042636.1 hypothetical protein [Vibrio parahaemolyticus]EJG0221724.1 hypothetical protein [Vibrio parahaemolyticus]EJG0231851.1 hypothetical protein [Vibrio parahaemolyticus]EJG0250896.1 hypothetical protein [Vibrio parahaemolyticus]EJG0388861.1 hypothetical protein [Vibrio parahaemolyticus]
MSQTFENLNELGCIEELETRLKQIQGILVTLESAMENGESFIAIQPLAKHSVTAALSMAEECDSLNKRVFKLLPREI